MFMFSLCLPPCLNSLNCLTFFKTSATIYTLHNFTNPKIYICRFTTVDSLWSENKSNFSHFFKRWSSRAQELKDKLNRPRPENSRVINADPSPIVAGSSTRLVGERSVARYLKPTRDDDDRVELLSDVDEHSYHDMPSSRYSASPLRSDRSSVPKNVFGDV